MLGLAAAATVHLRTSALGDRRTIGLLAPLVGFAISGLRFHGEAFSSKYAELLASKQEHYYVPATR